MNTQFIIAAGLIGETVSDILSADTNRDGKVSRAEIIALVMPLSMRLFTTIPKLNFPELLAEIRTSNTEARQAAIDTVKLKFDIPNDELEMVVEEIIDFLEDLYTDVEAYFTKAQDLIVRVRALRK